MELLVNLDFDSQTPLQEQLYDEMRRAILSGRLGPGMRVPSTRELARTLGISRTTVSMSFEMLKSEGYLEGATGSGTYVSREIPDDLLESEIQAETTGSVIQFKERRKTPRAAKPGPTFHKRFSWYGESLQATEWLHYSPEEPQIQFTFGRPDLRHFPMRKWMQLVNQHARRSQLSDLDCPSKAQGDGRLRKAIAEYLGHSRALNCQPEQIIVVNGSQQGIDLVARCLLDRNDLAGIEEPGYIGAQRSLLAHGAELLPIPVDHNGARIDELRKLNTEQIERLKLIYLTPSHQFPTGVVLSLPRRLELLSWAKRYGTYIVEDDYDSEYRYQGRPVPALAGLDKGDSVLYIGTFSKVLFPALRVGYLVVPLKCVDVFTRAKWLTDRHSPLLEQQALADFIEQGHLERHVRRMRSLYEHRRKVVMQAIESYLGDRATVLGDNAGLNVLVWLRSAISDVEIVQRCLKNGVGLSSTKQLYRNVPAEGEFLLNYAGLEDDEIRDGVRRLAKIALQKR